MPGMPPPQPAVKRQRLGANTKTFEHPDDLLAAHDAFEAWRKHPDQLIPIGSRKRPRMVSPAPSLAAFAAFVGVSRMTIHKQAARSNEFAEALNLIKDRIAGELISHGVVRNGQFTGDALKVAGVGERIEIVTEPKPTETASQRAVSDASLSYHPDDVNLEGPLMPLAAIRAGAKWPPENVQIEGTTA